VRLATWGDESDRLLFTRIAADFTRQSDDVRLEVEHIDASDADEPSVYARLAASIAGGTVADLLHLRGSTWHEFAARGSLHPLGELAARDKWVLPWPREGAYDHQTQFRGKRFLSSFSAAPQLLFYRRDYFQQAAVPLPRPDWPYVEFQDAARRLTRRIDGRQVYGYLWSDSYHRLAAWWRLQGGMEWDRISEPRKSSWTTPAVVEAVQYQLYDTQHTLQVAPSRAFLRGDPTYSRLDSGGIALMVEGPAHAWRLAGVPFDVQLLPTGPRGRRAHACPLDGQAITKNSKDRDAAWEALKWLGSEGAQVRVAEAGRLCAAPELARRLWLPLARSHVTNAEAFVRALEPVGGSTIGVVGELSERALDRDAGLGAALADVTDGRSTAKEALASLQARLQRALDAYWEVQRTRL
jgi:multiple sugar transport system substrate-binding protein